MIPLPDNEPSSSVIDVPEEFDVAFYRTYDDLRELTDQQLRSHYETRAPIEGRLGTHWALKGNFVTLIPEKSSVLEIGPFTSPSLRGPNIRYFDVLDREALIQQAIQYNMDFTNIPEINYVSPVGDLGIVKDTFDFVFSSHCIEHQPDLVRHLNQVANILPLGGYYFVVIPDKRFCFDHFRCETTMAAVIGAHAERRILNPAKSAIEHRLLMTHNDPTRHWNRDHGEPVWQTSGIQFIQQACKQVEEANGQNIETHAWHFTPVSFRAITEKLYKFGLSRMYPRRVYQTPFGTFEFCAVLEKADDSNLAA